MRANRVVLCVLVAGAVGCLLVCFLLLKPALKNFRKIFVSKATTSSYVLQQTLPSSSKNHNWGDGSAVSVRPLVPLSGASKEEVFALRKEAVAASPFARPDYEPSSAVFGQIVSGKPWYATSACSHPGSGTGYTQGPSEETRFINNPTALIAVEVPVLWPEKAGWCAREDTNLLIQNITYDEPKREITVSYLSLPFQTRKLGAFYAFNGLNARDLGYPYMYVDMSRSDYQIEFVSERNASTEVVKLQNFLHVGGSCRVKGGCNNGSPRQALLEFREDTTASTQPREIYIKLWKEEPASPQDAADMVERIIIEGRE